MKSSVGSHSDGIDPPRSGDMTGLNAYYCYKIRKVFNNDCVGVFVFRRYDQFNKTLFLEEKHLFLSKSSPICHIQVSANH